MKVYRKKKLLSLFLAMLLVIATMPQMAVKTQAAEAVCYVDGTNGSDANDGSESAPYQTINKAVDSLNWTSPEDDKTIYIKGVYDWTDSSVSGHGGLVIIKGADDTAQLNISNTIRLTTGSLKIENIKMHYSDNGIYIVQNNNELTIGEGVTTSGASGGWWQYMANIGMGTYQGTTSNTTTPVLSLSGGEFYTVFLGSSVITTGVERTNPGADFILNPGGFAQNVIIGGNGWDGNWGTNRYTDNVNLTFNGGSINNSVDISGHLGYWQGAIDFDGNAVQLIYNNGTYDRMSAKVKFTQSDVEERNGVYYQIKCANLEGSLIQTTDTAGKYTVEGNMTAKATNAETNEVVYSEDGVLTVPTAGMYDVEWVDKAPLPPKEEDIKYVDSIHGNDSGDGSEENPYATIDKAIEALNSIEAERKIIVIAGEYELSNFAAHSGLITIKGADETAKLNINSNVTLNGGDIKIENIILYYKSNGNYILQNGNELILGAGVTTAGASGDWSAFQPNLGTGGRYASGTYTNIHKTTINSGDYYRHMIGDSAITTGVTRTVPGVEYTINNGYVYNILIGGDGWSGTWGTNKFSGDINLVFNGGRVGTVSLSGYTTYFEGGVDFGGNAVQILCNDGTTPNVTFTADNVEEKNGSFYRINCEELEGSSLEVTETAGKYKVNSALTAIATNTDTQESVSSVDGVLTVPGSGTYTVKWQTPEIEDTVYVSAEGSDSNCGTEAAPFKSINTAIEALEESEHSSRTIILKGEFDMPSTFSRHNNMITIKGDGETNTKINMGTSCDLNGPTTLESISVNVTADGKFFNTNGYELVFGENVTLADWRKINAHLGTYTSDGAKQLATVKSGNFGTIWIGTYYQSAVYSTAGVDLVVDGGSISTLNVSADGWLAEHKGNAFTENVNITFNGGSFGKISLTDASRPTTYHKAVQIILNNGVSGNVPSNVETTGGYWLMKGTEGGALTVTDVAGEYNVTGGKTAIATSEDGSNVYISENGRLSVPIAGTYTITYTDQVYYTNSGTSIEFYQDCSVELSGMKHTEKEGKLFVGWVDSDGNGVIGKDFTQGTVLTARYIDYDSNSDFVMNGVQLKKTADKQKQEMRFQTKINNTFFNGLKDTVNVDSYGSIDIISKYLGTGDLALDGQYTSDGKNYTARNTVVETPLRESDDCIIYTGNILDLAGENFKEQYTAKGYIKYTDLNGYENILYTDYAIGSVYNTVKKALQTEGISKIEKEYFEAIQEYAEVALKEAYLNQKKTDIEIEHPYTAFYQYENGLMVREVEIEPVTAGLEEVEIVQASDFHFNYCNEQDYEENNPSTMSTVANRGLNPNGASVPQAIKCMEYGSFFDQTVVTGDALDYLSWGALELTKKYIWDPYPDTLVTLGNHEPVRVMGLPTDVPDPTTLESRYQILQEHWNHDIYYTSKVLKDNVMIIQMDNSQNKFWDSQIEKLQADIATAKANGYTVLLFVHVGLYNGNPNDTTIKAIRTNDTGEYNNLKHVIGYNASGATKEVYDIITNNADVIKGIFTGHMHDDYYTEIISKTSDGADATIPQYTLTGSFYEGGHVLKIKVK